MNTQKLADGTIVPHRAWEYILHYICETPSRNISVFSMTGEEFWKLFNEATKADFEQNQLVNA